ncbi:GA module [Gardnerella sp. KA01001]|uniref:GA module n=1 Tax=Gardnerella sp. KA01001 TaxID=2749081 RepID=UPI003BA8506B
MVKKTQAAKNALHVSKNYAYLKPSTLRSMAKEISGTRLEACKSYAVSRLPKIAVTATLASLLACGAGLPTHQAWANGFNLPDGSYRYANRDSSTKAQRYVDIKLVPCDEKQNDNKETADRKTYGQYYKVEYQFNSQGEWWGGRPFWWASVPKGVDIVDNKITLYKDEQLTGDSSSQQTGATYTKESWNQSASRFWFDNNKEQGTEFKNNWERMTGEAGGYDESGNTLGTSREYKDATSALIINWESRGNRKSKISFVIKLNDKTKPLKFAAGVYQVMGNWHYTAGKVALAPTLPKYSQELELTYPTDKVEVDSSTYGNNLSEDEKKAVLTKLWNANKSNTDVLKKLKGMEQTQTEEAFKKAVKVNNDGSATVTYKDNSTDTISKENLTKRYIPFADKVKINYPTNLTPVKNISQLSKEEKQAVKNAILAANTGKHIKDLTVDASGNATITFTDKIGAPSTKKLEGKYLVKKQRSLADKFTPYYPVPMAVGNPQGLTVNEQTELVKKVYEANKNKSDFIDAIGKPNNLEEAKKSITVDNKGNVTITYKDNTADFPSTDKLDGNKLVYQAKKLNETTYITLPARTAVKDAKAIQTNEQSTIRQAILTANSGLQSKLKGSNENTAITFDDAKHTMSVKFNDDSTSTFDYSELVYTKGNPEKPKTETKNSNGYKYNITKIAVADKNKLTQDDWHKFVRKFIQDNWKAKAGKSEINDQYINSTNGLLNQLHAPDSNTGGGMTLYKFFSDWDVTSGSTLKLGDNRSNKGIVSLYQHDDEVEIKALQGWNPNTVITLTKDDCFVSNAAAPQPKELKKEAENLIDKILKKNGLNDQEIKKFKEDHQGEINNITKPEDVDKIIKSANEHGQDEKKKKDAQKQINDAKNDLGLTPEQKTELDKKIGTETDPEKIREKINEFQKDQDQKKQKEADQKQQQADQQAEQEKQQQQQKDDAKVDGEVTKQNQQEQQDTGKAEEAKKKAELEKQKQAAINEINGNDKLKPEEKEQFINSIQTATDENAINAIKKQAAEKATQNQNAADNSNNDGLNDAKTDAKNKISKLKNLSEQDKKKYQDEVGTADSLDKVAEILNKAEFEDAKAAAKKKIADLKKHGDLTDQEATNFNAKLDDKNTDSIQDIDSILQEAELAKTRKDANTAIDNLQNLNNAQKKALKEEVANPETDPKSDLDTVDKVKTAINNVVTKAKDLDGKMKSLKNLVTLINDQKSTLTAKPDYKDNKKTSFESALKAAEDLVKTDSAENKTTDEVEKISKALEKAVKDLGGNTIDKSKLQDEIETAYELQGKNKQGQDDSSKKKDPKYENASTEKKNDFDTALSEAKKVYDKTDASQQSISDAESKLSKAIDALDGHDKTELSKAIKKANSKKSEIAYKNASKDKQSAFDRALNNAETIEKKAGASDTEISDAKDKLDNAINGLDGKVKTDELQTAVDNAKKLTGVTTPKSQDAYKYENASEAKKSAFDKALQQAESAITEAKNAKSTKTPEQKQQAVNTALTALTKAVNELDGNDKSQLVAKLAEAKGKKNDASYKNASAAKQAALDNAITSAESIVKKAGATEKEISDATSALNNAVTGLDGHDTSALQAAVTAAESKKKTVAYMNASDTKKTAFDNAVAAAQAILDSPKGKTEQEISDAKTQLETASNALDGTVDTSKLQVEVNKADSLKKSVQYTNAVQDKKSAYDTALTAAESALADAKNAQSANTPEQKQIAVNGALLQLQTAAAALNGVDIADLQAEIALENSVKESVKYVYDTAEKQQAYNKALQDAKELISKLADPAGQGVEVATKSQADRQALVNTALKSLKNAKDALNGVNKTVLQAEVDDDSHFSKSFAYLLGEAPDLDVYKKALAEAKRVLADPNATQAQVDAAVKNLSAARKALAAAKAHAADVRASVRAQVLKSGSVAQLSKTGSDVSVFGLFAATLSAAGAALFSAKRRGTSRHSNK